METSLRDRMHLMIDQASEERVQEMYELVSGRADMSVVYSPEEIARFYGLLEEHEQGRGKTFTVAETLANARKSRKPHAIQNNG